MIFYCIREELQLSSADLQLVRSKTHKKAFLAPIIAPGVGRVF